VKADGRCSAPQLPTSEHRVQALPHVGEVGKSSIQVSPLPLHYGALLVHHLDRQSRLKCYPARGMGDQTAIEWADATWNPVTGCTKISPGCKHCYAERRAARNTAERTPEMQRGYRPDVL